MLECLCVHIPLANISGVSLIVGVTLSQCCPDILPLESLSPLILIVFNVYPPLMLFPMPLLFQSLLLPQIFFPCLKKLSVSGGHTLLPIAWGLGSEGFGYWLQLMHCTCLLLRSEYFVQSQELKSKVWQDLQYIRV